MEEVPETLEGHYVLHDFRHIGRKSGNLDPQIDSIPRLAKPFVELPASSAAFRTIGHKSDLWFLHLRPTAPEIFLVDAELGPTLKFIGFEPAYSYFSVTELSLYEASARAGTMDVEEMRDQPFVKKRLEFEIPDMEFACFYPMNKRRGEHLNWYAETMDDRRKMMREHGSTGRKYAGRVIQMITGSTGLDDWEWGVTLFANDPLDIKKLVYEMRFDEVSAKYGEFGPFIFGERIAPNKVQSTLELFTA